MVKCVCGKSSYSWTGGGCGCKDEKLLKLKKLHYYVRMPNGTFLSKIGSTENIALARAFISPQKAMHRLCKNVENSLGIQLNGSDIEKFKNVIGIAKSALASQKQPNYDLIENDANCDMKLVLKRTPSNWDNRHLSATFHSRISDYEETPGYLCEDGVSETTCMSDAKTFPSSSGLWDQHDYAAVQDWMEEIEKKRGLPHGVLASAYQCVRSENDLRCVPWPK